MELQNYYCVLCNSNSDESLEHLFISCPFASACWNLLNLHSFAQADPFANLINFKLQLKEFFMEVVILMCRSICVGKRWFPAGGTRRR